MSDRQCLLGLDKLNDNYLNNFRPVCLFYKLKSVFPRHIKSWLGVCAAICGVCAKNSPETLQELAKQFISTNVFAYKDINNSQIQLADIPYTEFKFTLDNDLSYIFNICKKVIRRSQLHLTDFIAVCEYPDDIPCDELFEDTFEYDECAEETSTIQQTNDYIENIESEQIVAAEDETPEHRTLQADQIINTTNYEAFSPKALIINNGEDEDLLRLPATSWRDIVTKIFEHLCAEDDGILRRYYRNAPSISIITDRQYEQNSDDMPLCNTDYKFKANCSNNDLVRAIPDIINQSMFSPEQFAIEYTSGSPARTLKAPCEENADDIQRNYFQEALAEQTIEQTEDTASSNELNNNPFLPPTDSKYVCFNNAYSDLDNLGYNTAIRYRNFDPDDCKQYTHTKATAVYYDGECIAEVNSWKDAYYEVFVLIQKRYPTFYGPYRKLPCLYPIDQMSSLVDARGNCHAMAIPNTDFCIDFKKNVSQILRDLRKVVALSALEGNRLFITYEHTEKSLEILNNNAQAVIPNRYSATGPATAFVRRPKSDTTEQTRTMYSPAQIAELLEQATASTRAMRDDDKVTLNDDQTSLNSSPQRSSYQYQAVKRYTSGAIERKHLPAIFQKAKETQAWQAFVICYLILNGPQPIEPIIREFNPIYSVAEKNRYRSAIYSLSYTKEYLVKDSLSILSITDIDACLADPYVQKILKSVDADLSDIPEPEPKAPAINLDDQTRQNIEQILAQAFQYGYSHGIRQQEKFKEAYQNAFGKAIDCEDLDAAIDSVAFLMDERAYSFDAVLSAQRRDALMQKIDKWFEEGAPFIEYDALLQACELLPIKAAAALRTYLMHQLGPGYTYNKSSFAQDTTPELDEPLPESIANEVLYTGDITPLDTLAERFPYLTRETIASYLSANDAILSDKERYMHIESIDLDESDIDALNNTLNTLLDANPVLSYNEFIAELKENNESAADQLSNLLDASPAMLQQYLSLKLSEDFSFAKAISRPDDEGVQSGDTSIADIMANEFAGKTRIEMNEIEEAINKYGLVDFQPQVFRYFYDNFCRVSKNLFVNDSELEFDIQNIDQAIAKQCQDNYMPMQDFTISRLPYINYPWNEYLLMNYVYRYSKQFTIKNKTVTTKYCKGGLLVKKNSSFDIANYNKILVRYTLNTNPFPKNIEELGNLLIEHGLIVRKSSSLSGILAEAKLLKESKHV